MPELLAEQRIKSLQDSQNIFVDSVVKIESARNLYKEYQRIAHQKQLILEQSTRTYRGLIETI